MKIGCASYSYHRSIEKKLLDLPRFIRLCAEELGIDGVEILDRHLTDTSRANMRALKKLCVDTGMTFACIAVSNTFTVATQEAFDANLDRVKLWLERAFYMGVPVVRLFAGGARELEEIPGVWQRVVEGLAESARYAEEVGVVLGLENHGGFSADQVLQLLDEVGSPWLRLTLDFGNFPGDPVESTRRCAPYAVHVHAKSYEFGPDGGETKLDYPAMVGALKEAGFHGFLSIEFEGPGDEFEEVPKAVALLRRCAGT